MYCPFCGVENKDDANFCHNCGQQIPKLNPQPKKENALKSRILLYAVSAIAVVGVLLALIFGLKSCQSNDDPKEHTVATEQAQRGVTRAPSADMELSLESAESLIRKELRDRLREEGRTNPIMAMTCDSFGLRVNSVSFDGNRNTAFCTISNYDFASAFDELLQDREGTLTTDDYADFREILERQPRVETDAEILISEQEGEARVQLTKEQLNAAAGGFPARYEDWRESVLPCTDEASCVGRAFEDMPKKNNWAHNAIDWAVFHGITSGTDSTHFSPKASCTRGQVVTFLWRANGSPEPLMLDCPFEDVKSNAFYYKAVLWAVEKGITTGTSDTTFKPKAECTRAQVVTFLWRSEGSPEPRSTGTQFTDLKENASYYKAVLWAVENEITTGASATIFKPKGICTRAHTVTFLYRALGEK